MAGTGEGKKDEADYKRLHSFPLIRVRRRRRRDRSVTSAGDAKIRFESFTWTCSSLSRVVLKHWRALVGEYA